ncbi:MULTISPECIES: hypothetical protein [Aeromonas]|uniref:hypothetical protein n=1 Tax=Aeromonas TaxID=642 RepID=UPI000CDE2441|nr:MULTISPECIES: hypothetical protein [Aeromonas]AUZ74088.1 hypothetical protein C2U40_04220 [Aeromonas sp. ASNIH4]POU41818.1 hypothetical protein C3405_01605 [Aeromonas hydrophila]POV90542.1 hypothetical protein C3395_03515 [Aeromonas sp. ASNIH6]
MPAERYLFLIKGTLVLAQPLAAPETGELLTSLLQQGFAVGPLQVWASNAEQALACYEQAAQRRAFGDILAGSEPGLAGIGA